MKSTTQQEIAERLSVSRATVSRVLRNISGPKSSTAAKIIEVAREMGYRLPATENTLSRKGTSRRAQPVLGLLLCVPDKEETRASEVPMRILHGATDASRECNVLLHLEYMTESSTQNILSKKDMPESFYKKKIAGVLVTGPVPAQSVSRIMESCPCVRMNLHDRGVSMDLVGQDDRTAVVELIERLMTAGHRKIGFYCHTPPAPYALSRFGSYVEGLAQEGLEYNSDWCVNVWQSSGKNSLEKILQALESGVRAWVCEHDDLAYALIQDLKNAGVRVPEDVSVCGFDHLHRYPGMPQLTTVDWPLEDMAAAGVSMLIRRINEPARAVCQLLFSGRLIDGKTIGPANQI